jgi:hypothetical protein
MTSIASLGRYILTRCLATMSTHSAPPLRLHFGCLGTLLFAILASTSLAGGKVRVFRPADASHLRQIGQACLIYAHSHEGHLPVASDIWDYARLVAEDGGLDYDKVWTSKIDPAFRGPATSTVLIKNPSSPRQMNPEFRQIKPSVAVPLSLNLSMPATTPMLWTRGLQTDGTWAKHSPYGSDGGYIVFLGGDTAYFKNLQGAGGQLLRFDGKGPTANILEALPPDSRILEYTPTLDEQAAWAKVERKFSEPVKEKAPLITMLIIWIPFLSLSIYRLVVEKPNALTVLLWPLFITILLTIIVPTTS